MTLGGILTAMVTPFDGDGALNEDASVALMHHLLGGIRHLVWDTGHGLEKDTSTQLAWATLAGSVLLTVLIWAGYFWLGA